MAELGRRGGSRSPLTKLRKAADDELREKARQVLAEQLDGGDEKRRFEAAKSLYSFRAAAPPIERQREQQPGDRMTYGISDLIAAAVELGVLTGDNLRIGGEPVGGLGRKRRKAGGGESLRAALREKSESTASSG